MHGKSWNILAYISNESVAASTKILIKLGDNSIISFHTKQHCDETD
jgi:hypothetical protein